MPRFIAKFCTSILLLGALLAASPNFAQAQSIFAAQDATTRLNLSGRQRMLSQRMAKATCFIALDVEKEQHLDMLGTARSDFSEALFGLRFGHARLGLLRPTDPAVQQVWAPVVDQWIDFQRAVDLVLENPQSAYGIQYILENNQHLLIASSDAANRMAEIHGGSSISAELAQTINIADRQKMLSQKLGLEYCKVMRSPYDFEATQSFITAMDLFHRSHIELIWGDEAKGILPPPTEEIMLNLIEVETAWNGVKFELELAASGVPLDLETHKKVSELAARFLAEMHAATTHYASTQDT